MAAFTRTHDDATWTTGNYVTVVADWQSLSGKMMSGINADRGGAWAPSSPIVFTNGNLLIAAHALVAYGGSIVGNSGSPFRLSGLNEWPQYAEGHPFRQRKMLQSFLFAHHDSPEMWMQMPPETGISGLASIAIVVQDANGGQYRPAPLSLPLRVHDGATLTRATFTFRVLSERSKAPLKLPRFRVVRVDKFGQSTPLQSTSAGADAAGWVSPPAASKTSGAAWYADGGPQSLAYVCDQNNVIDIAEYVYFAEVIEEEGPTSRVSRYEIDGIVVRERKFDVRTASTGPALPELSDGVDPVHGGRMLWMNGYQPSSVVLPAWTNGLWLSSDLGGGGWGFTRATDLDAATDITPNFFVVATDGVVNRYRMFEVRPPYPEDVVNTVDEMGAGAVANPIYFGPLRPTGNAYSTVLLEFENITDMRFQ